MKAALKADPGSFRDRSNRVFVTDKAVYRALDTGAKRQWDKLQKTKFFKELAKKGQIVKTQEVPLDTVKAVARSGEWVALLEHERIPVISYPYEWCFGMLKQAALFHLDLMLRALEEGFILKDATPFNIQWVGAEPKLIDTVSFELLGDDNIWVAHRQFCELFLYPLMLQAYRKVPFQSYLRGSVDGIPVSDMANFLSFRDMFRSGVMTQVVLQNKLQQSFGGSKSSLKGELKALGLGAELIKINVRKLHKIISKLDIGLTVTEWGDYAENHSYSDREHEIKKQFIRDTLDHGSYPLVWDLGCNSGDFSKLASERGSYVVAADGDPLAIEKLFQKEFHNKGKTILPLVIKLNDPTPGIGWCGRERSPFVERSKPSLVFFLALIHHMVISANIPLREVISWLASLGSSLIIEFVSKEDEMVKQLLLNRVDQYDDYTSEGFETVLSEFFTIERRIETKAGKREIFLATPRKK